MISEKITIVYVSFEGKKYGKKVPFIWNASFVSGLTSIDSPDSLH